MTVFKGYVLMIRRNLGVILMYIFIFVGIAGVIQASYLGMESAQGFTSLRLDVAVLDRDGGALAETICSMLGREHHLKALEDEEEVIQDKLYYRDVEYVLVIPKGVEEGLADGKSTVESITVPNSTAAYYVDAQVNALLNQVRAYLTGGFSMEEACEKALALGEIPVQVELIDMNGNSGIREDYNYYFGYMPYAFLGATVMSISLVIMEFKKKDIRRRMQSSAVPFQMQNLAAIGSFLAVGGMIWLICVAIQTVMYRGGIFTSGNVIYYILNSAAFMLVALSLGYFSGIVSNGAAALNGINNVISLGLCFLGGIFVPLEMLGSGVQKVAQILPTYWYSVVNSILGDYKTLSSPLLLTIWKGIFIQVLFAAACFGITLALRRLQMQEKN